MRRKKELTSFQMIREMVKFYFQIKARRDRIYRKPKRVSGAIQKAFRDHSRQILVENPKAVLSAAGEFVTGKQHTSAADVVSKHFKNYAVDYSPSKPPVRRKHVGIPTTGGALKATPLRELLLLFKLEHSVIWNAYIDEKYPYGIKDYADPILTQSANRVLSGYRYDTKLQSWIK